MESDPTRSADSWGVEALIRIRRIIRQRAKDIVNTFIEFTYILFGHRQYFTTEEWERAVLYVENHILNSHTPGLRSYDIGRIDLTREPHWSRNQ